MQEVKFENISLHKYSSIDEYLDKIHDLKDWLADYTWENSSDDRSNPEWYWTKNFNEALELIHWFEIRWTKFKFDKKSWDFTIESNSVAWWRVDMWAYLSWNPENMIHNDILPDKPKLRVLYHIGASAWYDSEELMKRAWILFGALQWLENEYEIEAYCWFLALLHGSYKVWMMARVKEFKWRFIRNRFAFTLHTSFFRRIWFRYLETRRWLPEWYWKSRPFENNFIENQWIWLYIPDIRTVPNDELEKFIKNKMKTL